MFHAILSTSDSDQIFCHSPSLFWHARFLSAGFTPSCGWSKACMTLLPSILVFPFWWRIKAFILCIEQMMLHFCHLGLLSVSVLQKKNEELWLERETQSAIHAWAFVNWCFHTANMCSPHRKKPGQNAGSFVRSGTIWSVQLWAVPLPHARTCIWSICGCYLRFLLTCVRKRQGILKWSSAVWTLTRNWSWDWCSFSPWVASDVMHGEANLFRHVFGLYVFHL